jgi:hypothetical protein
VIGSPIQEATMFTTRHIHCRAVVLGLACALLGSGAAAARPIDEPPTPLSRSQDLRNPDNRVSTSSLAGTTGSPRQDLRSPDARDAAAGRGTFNAPEVTVVKLPQPAPSADDGGIDWGDAGIGAGSLLVIVAIGLGGTAAVMRHRTATAG